MLKPHRLAAVVLILALAFAAVPDRGVSARTWGVAVAPPEIAPSLFQGQTGPPPNAQSTSGPEPPPDLLVNGGSVQPHAPVLITGVPAYDWRHGCGPTAAGMVLGYWDAHGFGALVPGDASTQTTSVDRMIASGDLPGDTATNYTDYCLPMDTSGLLPDRSEPPAGDEHPDHCLADFFKTSQSAHGNRYGWGYFSPIGPGMRSYVDWLGRPDYTTTTDNAYMYYTPALTWEGFRAEIDSGRPMVFLVDTNGNGSTDHFVTVIGYDDSTHSYGCLDTWGSAVRWETFAPLASGQGWGIWGGITFQISINQPGMSRATAAADTGRDSWRPSLNAGGTAVAFVSDADLLGQGIPDEQSEIWLRDTATMTYTRVTTATADRDSDAPFLSASGMRIAFRSDADLLGRNNPDDRWEIWLHDSGTMTYTQVTSTTEPARDSWDPVLDADGSAIAFASDADLLGQGIPDDQLEIWLYNTGTMTYTRVTTATASRDSYEPALNGDGTVVAFRSDADLLGRGTPVGQFEVWLYDTGTMTYTRVTTAADAGRDSMAPVLSADGTQVVFYSDADLLGQGIPVGQFEVWLYDTVRNAYRRITWASDAERDSYLPVLSADGQIVAFYSDSDILAQIVPEDQYEVWLYGVREVYLPVVLRGSP